MSFAMRECTIEYCQPLRPRLKRPFSETHITRNIKAQKIGYGTDFVPIERFGDKKDMKGSQEDLLIDNEAIEYTPTNDVSKTAYKKFLSQIADVLKRENGQPLTEEELKGAANLALFSIKHDFVVEAEDGEDFIEVMDVQIDGVPLMNLRHLAIGMTDYPKQQSFISETTTVTAGDQTSVLSNPQRWRDAELISEDTINSHTYTGSQTPPLDILVRTSGVERLSDFLLWQCHQKTDVVFAKCMWPQFGLRKFLPIILEWQWRQKKESYWREAQSDWQKLE
jgi:hypothetical protein